MSQHWNKCRPYLFVVIFIIFVEKYSIKFVFFTGKPTSLYSKFVIGMMGRCLLCTRTGRYRIEHFSVFQFSIKEIILIGLGYEVEQYLPVAATICKCCVWNVMWLVALRDEMIRFLVPNFRASINVSKTQIHAWVSRREAFEPQPIGTGDSSSQTTPTHNNNVHNSSELLEVFAEEPYSPMMERRIADAVRITNKTPAVLKMRSDDADAEVSRVLSRAKGRRRGFRWTHRKNGRYSTLSGQLHSLSRSRSRRSRLSRPVSAVSRASWMSRSSTASSDWLNSEKEESEEEEVAPPKSSILELAEDPAYECYTCTRCSLIFRNIDQRTEHRILVHNEMALFTCHSCRTSYTTREDLRKHSNSHPNADIACNICDRVFINEYYLGRHWSDHYEEATACHICRKRFLGGEALRRHHLVVHVTGPNPRRIDYKGETIFGPSEDSNATYSSKVNHQMCPVPFKKRVNNGIMSCSDGRDGFFVKFLGEREMGVGTSNNCGGGVEFMTNLLIQKGVNSTPISDNNSESRTELDTS